MPEILVAGFTPPSFPLPSWARFHSIGAFVDYPVNRWSDGLLDLVQSQSDSHFIFFHEDYLLVRQVDVRAIRLLYQLAQSSPNLLRVDLCTDRFSNASAVEIGHLGHLDLYTTPPSTPYCFSHQPSLFNTHLLPQIEKRGESPWQGELNGNLRLSQRPDLQVIGTRQAPIRHLIAINKGELDLTGAWQFPKPLLSESDRQDLLTRFPILTQHLEKSYV